MSLARNGAHKKSDTFRYRSEHKVDLLLNFADVYFAYPEIIKLKHFQDP